MFSYLKFMEYQYMYVSGHMYIAFFFLNGSSLGSRRRDCRSHLRMTQVIGRKNA